jgi:hypothetical protein
VPSPSNGRRRSGRKRVPASLERRGSIRGFLGTRLIAEIADLLILVGVALAVCRYRLPKVVGAILAGGTAMVLVLFNGSRPAAPPWSPLAGSGNAEDSRIGHP